MRALTPALGIILAGASLLACSTSGQEPTTGGTSTTSSSSGGTATSGGSIAGTSTTGGQGASSTGTTGSTASSSSSGGSNTGTSTTGTTGSNGDGGCSFTLGGARTDASSCTASALGAYVIAENTAYRRITLTGPSFTVTADVSTTGMLVIGSTTAQQAGGTVLGIDPNVTGDDWAANGFQGSYTVRLTSLGTQTQTSTETDFAGMHGTIDAVMPPLTGSSATGTLTAHGEF
jgi:hypothetical protein